MTMTAEEQFDSFSREYDAWYKHTQALPLRLNRSLATRSAFEVDLDHVIDYVRPILAAAAERSTKFDYPKVANEYLNDLDQIRTGLEGAPFCDEDRQTYSEYVREFRYLLGHLGLLPVPLEGHLGFRSHALQAFRFLIDEYGFEVAETSPTSVRFVRDAMFVTLSYSPEFPLDSLLVGTCTSAETPPSGFILDDFAYVAGLGVIFDYERFNLRDSGGLAKFLQTAASLVRRHGASLLRGAAEASRELQNKADERERSYIEIMERSAHD